jgi:hypothetical protein
MKSAGAKCIHVLLALFILAAAVVPACAGSEDCSMPCCRQKAKPASHHSAPAHSKPCCTQTTDASAGIDPGCRFVQYNPALPAAGDAGPVATAAVVAAAIENPIMLRVSTPAAWCLDSLLPDTPLYLRLQTLLI